MPYGLPICNMTPNIHRHYLCFVVALLSLEVVSEDEKDSLINTRKDGPKITFYMILRVEDQSNKENLLSLSNTTIYHKV